MNLQLFHSQKLALVEDLRLCLCTQLKIGQIRIISVIFASLSIIRINTLFLANPKHRIWIDFCEI